MKESLNLFKQWANHKAFADAPLILALTKKDLYHENFDAGALKRAFPDFGGATSAEGLKFIQEKFEDRLAKRNVSAPFKAFALDTTSKTDALDLLNHIRQLVATHRSSFLMNAVQNAVDARKAKKKPKRSSLGGMGGRRSSAQA